jgi:hypothetical protein
MATETNRPPNAFGAATTRTIVWRLVMVSFHVQKTVQKFNSLREADRADHDFYKKLSPQERLNILLQLSKHEPERRLERVYRVIKLPRH